MAVVEDQRQGESIVPDGEDRPLLGFRIVEEGMVRPMPAQAGCQQSGQERYDSGGQPTMPAGRFWNHHA
jgi:hypothetical protein